MATASSKPVLRRTVVLVGMMGSGKTAIGRSLAAALDVAFLDSDTAIEEAASLSIAEIFARDGEPFFRAREAEVIDRLLSGPPAILSTGGGAFLAPATRDLIAKKGVAVWLNADLTTLWERVRHKNTRPLLRTADPLATLTGLMEVRAPIYAEAALHVPIAPTSSIEETTQAVLETLATDPTTLEPAP
jgi:shikimate kinase